jgi:UDP-glucose 4-epimerase
MNKFDTVVVGGTGFVGEYLVSELVSAGQKVSVFHAHAFKENRLPSVFYFRDNDSPRLLEEVIKASDKIVFMVQPNINLLKRVLKYIPHNSNKTFLYTSTVMIYKGGKNPQKETGKLFPINSFAKEKYKEEKIVSAFAAKHKKMPVLMARIANVYGGLKNRGLIGLAFQSLFEKKEIIIAKDGGQTRDFVYVDDVAKALKMLLAVAKNGVCVVNISTGAGHTLIEMVKMIETVTGKKITYNFGPSVEETYSVIGDSAKLKSIIEWQASSLKDGLAETYKRYIIQNKGKIK